ncbi:BQ2448_3262 [Microbotryum intermedium]|uniref:BQ2448_3262 protein n=1 Tax=Microbotryum intermedium TaxID=269621 RepID=A0A238FIH5_9BASI|nr:BQ2448_3262 [Microbotryum intermedium]
MFSLAASVSTAMALNHGIEATPTGSPSIGSGISQLNSGTANSSANSTADLANAGDMAIRGLADAATTNCQSECKGWLSDTENCAKSTENNFFGTTKCVCDPTTFAAMTTCGKCLNMTSNVNTFGLMCTTMVENVTRVITLTSTPTATGVINAQSASASAAATTSKASSANSLGISSIARGAAVAVFASVIGLMIL